MAKDAKGHGSEKRGEADMSNPLNSNQHKVLTDTLKMPSAMAGVMGGPSQAEAEATLRGKFGYGDKDIAALTGKGIGGVSGAVRAASEEAWNKEASQDRQAASTLAAGTPPSKAGPAPVHPGAAGRQDGGPTNPRYNRDAVNAAIASSNRSGRKIGGKEAAAIHRLLSGGH